MFNVRDSLPISLRDTTGHLGMGITAFLNKGISMYSTRSINPVNTPSLANLLLTNCLILIFKNFILKK